MHVKSIIIKFYSCRELFMQAKSIFIQRKAFYFWSWWNMQARKLTNIKKIRRQLIIKQTKKKNNNYLLEKHDGKKNYIYKNL